MERSLIWAEQEWATESRLQVYCRMYPAPASDAFWIAMRGSARSFPDLIVVSGCDPGTHPKRDSGLRHTDDLVPDHRRTLDMCRLNLVGPPGLEPGTNGL